MTNCDDPCFLVPFVIDFKFALNNSNNDHNKDKEDDQNKDNEDYHKKDNEDNHQQDKDKENHKKDDPNEDINLFTFNPHFFFSFSYFFLVFLGFLGIGAIIRTAQEVK